MEHEQRFAALKRRDTPCVFGLRWLFLPLKPPALHLIFVR